MSEKEKTAPPVIEQVEIHKCCGGEVRGLPPDSISYCIDCEHIVEGDTEFITTEEFESRLAESRAQMF